MTDFDQETLRRLVDGIPAGTRLAIVAGPSPQACKVMAAAGMKVFCVMPNDALRQFCVSCGPSLYTDVFPVTGDHEKLPTGFPVKVDAIFVDTPGDISVQDWLPLVVPSGLLSGSAYNPKLSTQVGHRRNMWWRRQPGGVRAKCAWEMMPDGGYRYLQTIATSARVNL